MPNPHKPQEVLRMLVAHDRQFQIHAHRGKGSHRLIYHPNVHGQARSFPLTFHKGRDIGKGMLKAIIRRFELPNNFFG